MVGGKLIEIAYQDLVTDLGYRLRVARLWCMDGWSECCIYAEPHPVMPKLGETIWWQSGKIYFRNDAHYLRKIGFSFTPPLLTRPVNEPEVAHARARRA